jgi:hypothetical protein
MRDSARRDGATPSIASTTVPLSTQATKALAAEEFPQRLRAKLVTINDEVKDLAIFCFNAVKNL